MNLRLQSTAQNYPELGYQCSAGSGKMKLNEIGSKVAQVSRGGEGCHVWSIATK
jgi:hypothetical protein